jgi:cytochrome c-type biogenesis protein CcmH
MMLWFVFALMTAAAMFAVFWPLHRGGASVGGSETTVYRDQLDEIDRDQAIGLIGPTEAEAAKVEVSRRLIAAANAANADKPVSDLQPRWHGRAAVIVSLVILPLAMVSFYLRLGSPQLPGMALATRVLPQEKTPSIESMIAQVEDHVGRNPTDGRAWEVLAPVYMRVGRFDDAARAWGNTIRLNGSTASREADFGEALVAAGDGVVTADAKAAFDRALTLDRNNVMARFYIGMAADQDGHRADAETIWRELLASAPPEAPWIEIVRHAMARTAPSGTAPAAVTGTPGPSAADMAAAAKLPPDQQNQMIVGMVSRLADRLKQDGSDTEGWVRLIRSYRALGQNDKAEAALADARRTLANDSNKLEALTVGIEMAAAAAPQVPVVPGPSAQDIAAAQDMNEKDRGDMIRGMVLRLADKLKQDGSDVEGWQRLLRAYLVLGERDKAVAAANDARHALAGDADKLRRLEDAIKALGLGA